MSMFNKRYYLDYAASTPVVPQVMQAMKPFWSDSFANPNSIHQSGLKAKQALQDSVRQVNTLANMEHNGKVVWTSGGTESNHLAIAYARGHWKASHSHDPYTIMISSIEHPSVVNYLESIHDPLLNIVYVPVDEEGLVKLEFVTKNIASWENVILASCIFQSSEVGTTQPIKKLSEIIRKESPDTLIHTDASQGMMYHKLNAQDWDVDMITLCGQKIHGPKGIGALLCRNLGTGFLNNEKGTSAVPLIAGFTKALELAQANTERSSVEIQKLTQVFLQNLKEHDIAYVLNGRTEEASCILNLSFPSDDRDSEQLVVAFDQHGLEVSSQSACMGSQAEDSRILLTMGLSPTNSIRLCLHHEMGSRDIKHITQKIKAIIKD